MKYNLTLEDLMDFFCETEHQGFCEQEIQQAEQRIDAALPEFYHEFLLKYGRDTINTRYNNINEPENICTSYQIIAEALKDWASEFEEAVLNNQTEEYADNEYFTLWGLSQEEWHTVTENYVLLWCENQGVWNAGYLLKDLQNGEPDPPFYISTNDDFVTFAKASDNAAEFIEEMLREAAWGYHSGERYTDAAKIVEILAENGISLEQMKSTRRLAYGAICNMGTCLNVERGQLYFYYEHGNYQELIECSREKPSRTSRQRL